MRPIFGILTMAVLFLAIPGPCFGLWEIATLSKERAKEMGMEVRSNAAGLNDVGVELEFKIEGEVKDFSRVDMRISEGGRSVVTAALREDRTKPGRVVVSFSADRTRLDKIVLWVMVPGSLGGSIYELRVKDFVELEKGR
jgi:hypothetical protein